MSSTRRHMIEAALPHPQNRVQAIAFERLRSLSWSAACNWAKIVTRDPCTYCGSSGRHKGRTFEHVEPASLGGTRHFTNAAGACRECQQGRGNAPFLLFYLTRRVVAARGVGTRRIVNGRILSRPLLKGDGFDTPCPAKHLNRPCARYGRHYHCKSCGAPQTKPGVGVCCKGEPCYRCR